MKTKTTTLSRRAALAAGASTLALAGLPAAVSATAAPDPDAGLHAAIARWYDYRATVTEPLRLQMAAIEDAFPVPTRHDQHVALFQSDAEYTAAWQARSAAMSAAGYDETEERFDRECSAELDLYLAALALPAMTAAGMLAKLRLAADNGGMRPDEITREWDSITGDALESVWRDLERMAGAS